MAPVPGLPLESSRRPCRTADLLMRPLRLFFPQELRAGPGPPIQTGPLAPDDSPPFSEVEPPRIPALGKPTEGSPSPLLGWPRTPPTWDGGALPGPQYLWGLVPLQGTPPYQVLEIQAVHSVSPSLPTPRLSPHCCYPRTMLQWRLNINKQGGTRSTRLKSCGHGAGAGILSRSPSTAPGRTSLLRTSCPAARVPPSEWTLHSQVMATIFRTLGPFYVDLFASALYAQLQRYCAQALDPAAWRIEPSRFGGRYSRGTFFPRPIPRILQKVRQDRATVPLIAPWWPKRTWFLVMITPSSGVSENPHRSQGRDIPADTGDPCTQGRPPSTWLLGPCQGGRSSGRLFWKAAAVVARSRRDSTREAYIPVLQDFSVGANLRGWIPVRHLWRTWPFSELPFW